MTNNEKMGQSPCCEGGDCCSSSSTKGSSGRWKIIAFAFVILLACAITAYSLLRPRPVGSAANCCPSGASASTGIGEAATVEGLGGLLAGAQLALIVFPQLNDSIPPSISAVLDSVKREIGADSAGLRMLTLYPDNPAFIVAINHYDINDYPSVLAMGGSVSRVLTKNSINKATMVGLFRQCKATGSSCCPTSTTK